MRAGALLIALAAVALAGCGDATDWWPEEYEYYRSLGPGESEDGTVHASEDYGSADDWDLVVRGLPPGFTYVTEHLHIDEEGDLEIDWEIRVADWVPPGRYEFEVEYRLYDFFWPWRDEVEIEFLVDVVAPAGEDGHDELLLRAIQRVPDGESSAANWITFR